MTKVNAKNVIIRENLIWYHNIMKFPMHDKGVVYVYLKKGSCLLEIPTESLKSDRMLATYLEERSVGRREQT